MNLQEFTDLINKSYPNSEDFSKEFPIKKDKKLMSENIGLILFFFAMCLLVWAIEHV